MMVVQPGRFSSFACQIDPFSANRTFFLRGNGANGAKPSTDDIGNALSYFGDTALSNASPLYWPDYKTTMRQTSGRLVVPASRFDLGVGGAPFSLLIRLAVFGGMDPQHPTVGTLLQNAVSPSSWGPLQNQLVLFNGGADLRWQFNGSSSPTSLSMAATSGNWSDSTFREILITYDGTTTSGYCNGTRVATTTGTYTKTASSVACVGSGVDGSFPMNMAYVDLTVYNTCLTAASSYTLPNRAPCQ